MATQRLTLAKISGVSAKVVGERFRLWEELTMQERELDRVAREVDRFAIVLRDHAHLPPVTYFAEWTDLWSMGDLVPGLGQLSAVVVEGRRFEACCHDIPVAVKATTIHGAETQEAGWLRSRIQEAKDAWGKLALASVLVVLREPLGALVTDEELLDSQTSVPHRLAAGLEQE
jgi:hypothetical protein